jgi:hypothetical protein
MATGPGVGVGAGVGVGETDNALAMAAIWVLVKDLRELMALTVLIAVWI